MNIYTSKKIKSLIATALLSVLAFMVLIKPVHILFIHHDIVVWNIHDGQFTLSNAHENNCPICEFEFCSFDTTTVTSVPEANITVVDQMIVPRYEQAFETVSHLFQLRAPPVV